MVWIGFQRPPNSPDWIGSFKDSASEKILPRLISRPASITSCAVTLFSVPIWSSLPQRPQFDSFFAASSIAARSTFMVFLIPVSFSSVIASEAKQSSNLAKTGLLRRCAPRNDGGSYGAAKIQPLDDVITLQLIDGLRRHHDLAVHDDISAVRYPDRLIKILLAHQHGQAKMLVELADLRDGLRDQERRQADRRLVDQQQSRRGHQRPRNRQHLLLAARH